LEKGPGKKRKRKRNHNKMVKKKIHGGFRNHPKEHYKKESNGKGEKCKEEKKGEF